MAGNALMKIRQELLHLHQTFKILAAHNDQDLATVKQQFTFLRPKFCINSVFGEYVLHGLDMTAHYFTLMKNNCLVATVSKQFFSWSDTYGIEIIGEENDAFIIALVIILDQIIYDNKEKQTFQ
uniref:Uncharacterized protein n=1 Tax=Panagrolaimus superbus TaxID=310955 RepID=A0A914YQ11_9BILA